MASFTTPSDRYRSLVRQLGEERDFRYGWRSEVARLLSVHPSYVSRIAGGEEVRVGADAVARAAEALGLAPRFFHDETLQDPHYRRFVAGQPQPLGEVLVTDADVDASHAEWARLYELATASLDLGRRENEETIAAAQALCSAVLGLRIFRYARTIAKHCEELASEVSPERRRELIETISVQAEVLGLQVRKTATSLAMEPPATRGAPEPPIIMRTTR